MKIFLSITTSLLIIPLVVLSQNTTITSFSKSKKQLAIVYQDNPITLYCGCSFKGKTSDFSPCGYVPKKNNKRANRIEWEHVVPAYVFGIFFSEWTVGHPKCIKKNGKKYKGRRCAGKVNKEFKRMEADMCYLFPAIGEVNGLRSNYPMTIIKGEDREFGKCDVEIKSRKVEPRDEVRGEIARTYMYMDSVYPGKGIISNQNRSMFEEWNRSDPADEWECERARRIEKIQGNRNEIVLDNC